MPYEQGAGAALKEINDFASLLGTAIPAGDKETVALAVDTIGGELRELTEHYPDRKDTSVPGGEQERAMRACGAQGSRADAPANRYGGRRRPHRGCSRRLPELSLSHGRRRSFDAGRRRAMVALQCRGARPALRGSSSSHAVEAHVAVGRATHAETDRRVCFSSTAAEKSRASTARNEFDVSCRRPARRERSALLTRRR